jgi:hypothetical protein
MELVMDDWTKEQADFLVKIGQLPPVTPATPKPTTKKEEG